MDFAATLFSTGWASGVNAYGTVALLGILGRQHGHHLGAEVGHRKRRVDRLGHPAPPVREPSTPTP